MSNKYIITCFDENVKLSFTFLESNIKPSKKLLIKHDILPENHMYCMIEGFNQETDFNHEVTKLYETFGLGKQMNEFIKEHQAIIPITLEKLLSMNKTEFISLKNNVIIKEINGTFGRHLNEKCLECKQETLYCGIGGVSGWDPMIYYWHFCTTCLKIEHKEYIPTANDPKNTDLCPFCNYDWFPKTKQ